MKKNKKGFTLIELLAVIIILGVLMLIAIPSVTEYINSSRRNAVVDSAGGYISAVRVKVNQAEDFIFTEEDTLYLVPVSNIPANSCVSIEKGGSSPFGKWLYAYVGVVFTGNGYTYYWASRDEANNGTALIKESELDKDKIKTYKEIAPAVTTGTLNATAQAYATTAGTTHAIIIAPDNGSCKYSPAMATE